MDPYLLADNFTTVGVDERIELARWSSGNALLVGALLCIAALYGVLWMYRREARGNLSRRLRWTLVGCRVSVLVILGFIGLEPVVVKYLHRRLSGTTIILADESASMSLADRYRRPDDRHRIESAMGELPNSGLARATICEKILGANEGRWLKSLSEKNDVKLFSFADGVKFRQLLRRSTADAANQAAPAPTATSHDDSKQDKNQPSNDASDAIKLASDGPATDLGHAVRSAIDSLAGGPVAGVVLLTDGGFNRGESSSVIGRYLKQKHIKLLAVGIGDPAEPVNVRITQVSAPRTVFKNDPFSVTVHLEADGIEGQKLTVELLERRGGVTIGNKAAAKTVDARRVRPDPSGRIPPIVFKRKIGEPGRVRYLARVGTLPFESVTSDNQRVALPDVRILDDKMKVLLIAGSPGYDYRFLARMLERDATVDLSAWLQSADVNAVRDGNSIITELPTTAEEINKYDAVILMDCDPVLFDPMWGSTVATYVSDHGGGLLYEAGNKYTGRLFRSPKMTSIVEVLPIVPDPEAEIVINEQGHYQMKAWPILVPDEAADNPILQQSDNPAETKAIWAMLGGVYWHYPVRREKPVAQALMRHSNPRMVNSFGPHVLFATQYVGTGRTAYLGINSTWRWRRSDERYFNRFWIQTLRFLVEGKLLGGRSRSQIITAKQQYELGESVVIKVRALNEDFSPLMMPELSLSVRGAGNTAKEDVDLNETVRLEPIPGRDGYYEGRFVPKRVDTYQLTLQLPGQQSSDSSVSARDAGKEIRVSQPNIEMRNTAMNQAGLKSLVEAAGGESRYFDVDEASKIPEILEDRSRTFMVRGRPRPLWDNSYVFSLLIALLTIEWILRKKAKLL